MGSRKKVAVQDVLELWEARYGKLSPQKADRFRTKCQELRITAFQKPEIAHALNRHQRLERVLGWLDARDPGVLGSSGDQAQPHRVERVAGDGTLSESEHRDEVPSYKERPSHGHPAEPLRRPRGSAERRRVGYPEPPKDAELLKRLGPIQQYDDSF